MKFLIVLLLLAPKARFDASPRISLWAYRPIEVFARLVVTNPTEEWTCLTELWAWGDGSSSVRQDEFCVVGNPPGVLMLSARHAYRTPGTYTVTLFLFKGSKRWKVFRSDVQVLGP